MKEIDATRSKRFCRKMKREGVRCLAVTLSWALLALLVLYLFLHSPISFADAASVIRYVAPSGADGGTCSSAAASCRTLQYAVSQASPGDEIRVAQGSYTGTVTINKDLVLRGGFTDTNWVTPRPERQRTTVDAQGEGRVIEVPDTAPDAITVRTEGFELRGGDVGGGTGGGCYNAKGHLILVDNVIHHNQAPDSGSGGGIASDARLTLKGNRIYANAAQRGGSVYVGGSVATIESNGISDGFATLAGAGSTSKPPGQLALRAISSTHTPLISAV